MTWWVCWSRAWSSSPMSTSAASCASWWRVWTTAIRTTSFIETSNAPTSCSTTGKEWKKWTPGVIYCSVLYVDSCCSFAVAARPLWTKIEVNFDVSLSSTGYLIYFLFIFVYFSISDPLRQIDLQNTSFNAALSTSTPWSITADGLNATVVFKYCELKTQSSRTLILMLGMPVFFKMKW